MSVTADTPLWWNNAWGPYNGVSDMKEVVRQLMKVLILTVPGENPAELDVNFGVGLRNVLFMNDYPGLRADIEVRIKKQINTYIRTGDTGEPMVRLLGVQFSPYPVEDADPKLSVRVSYTILMGTSESDVIEEDIPADSGGPFEDGQLFPPGDRSPGQEFFPEREVAGWPNIGPQVGGIDGLFGELKWKN